MKTQIELARAREERTSELAAQARYARERLALYRARAYGPKLTSPARLRELERACELAETRLSQAQTAPQKTPPDVEAAREEAGPAAPVRGETDDGIEFV